MVDVLARNQDLWKWYLETELYYAHEKVQRGWERLSVRMVRQLKEQELWESRRRQHQGDRHSPNATTWTTTRAAPPEFQDPLQALSFAANLAASRLDAAYEIIGSSPLALLYGGGASGSVAGNQQQQQQQQQHQKQQQQLYGSWLACENDDFCWQLNDYLMPTVQRHFHHKRYPNLAEFASGMWNQYQVFQEQQQQQQQPQQKDRNHGHLGTLLPPWVNLPSATQPRPTTSTSTATKEGKKRRHSAVVEHDRTTTPTTTTTTTTKQPKKRRPSAASVITILDLGSSHHGGGECLETVGAQEHHPSENQKPTENNHNKIQPAHDINAVAATTTATTTTANNITTTATKMKSFEKPSAKARRMSAPSLAASSVSLVASDVHAGISIGSSSINTTTTTSSSRKTMVTAALGSLAAMQQRLPNGGHDHHHSLFGVTPPATSPDKLHHH